MSNQEMRYLRVDNAIYEIVDSIARISINGYPSQVTSAAQMNDTSQIYLYKGSEEGYINGNWYHYDGERWRSGGRYKTSLDASSALYGQVPIADGEGSWQWGKITGSGGDTPPIEVDASLSDLSINPVQNKVIKAALDNKANAGIGRSNTTSSMSPSLGGKITMIDSITTNGDGQVTKVNTKTVTLPFGDYILTSRVASLQEVISYLEEHKEV